MFRIVVINCCPKLPSSNILLHSPGLRISFSLMAGAWIWWFLIESVKVYRAMFSCTLTSIYYHCLGNAKSTSNAKWIFSTAQLLALLIPFGLKVSDTTQMWFHFFHKGEWSTDTHRKSARGAKLCEVANSIVNALHGHFYCSEKFETFDTSILYFCTYKPHHPSLIVADWRICTTDFANRDKSVIRN